MPRAALSLACLVALASCKVPVEGPDAAPKAASAPTKARPASVTPLERTEHRQKDGGKGDIRVLARGDNAFLGRLELAPGGKVPEHRDPTEEYIHILEGGGRFTIDGQVHEVGPGTTIYMPPGALVSFENGPAKLVAIQVFAGPEPAGKYEAWQLVAP